MASRLKLHNELQLILGSSFIYFQPPESVKMNYPCIVYTLGDIDTKYADDKTYLNTKRYEVSIIDYDPDSEIPDKMMSFPMCSFDRSYVANNLNHWVFNLYF